MAQLWENGLRVWLSHKGQMLPATVTNTTTSNVSFSSVYGNADVTYARGDINRDLVKPMHQTSVDTVEDMAGLGDLHEGAILYNISQRYTQNLIYTYIGSILVAVNPYKKLGGLYGNELIELYMDRQLGELPPSIYAISNEVYVSMWKMRHNQCVLISGESGAGKTESTKFMLSFLSYMSQRKQGGGGSKNVESAILESSPILEAFGNAKTVYNNNSSRFGKFIRLNFSEGGSIEGGKILDYLLEKNRVVRQNPQERNYHIFYAMLAGTTPKEKEKLQLGAPESFYYLSQSGCISDPTINDERDFDSVRNAFAVMDLEDQIMEILGVLGGILHLGNIKFLSAAGAQIANQDSLEVVAGLLALDSFRLGDALTKKFMVLRGEEITTPLTIEQAADSRDSTAMRIYANLFRWILEKINARIKGGEDKFAFIGVLDIFGFENFSVNRFEQFCINFANEKLQEFFNKHIFSLEQHEYSKEGIDWADIEWVDNAECLNLIEKKLGVLDLLDEESRFPKGTDQSLLTKLHGSLHQNAFYVKPKVNNGKFGIKHYAGEVFYDVNGQLEKNRDTFRDDVLKVLKDSRSDFVYDLFDHMNTDEGGGGGGGGIVGRKPTALGKRGGKRKKATVSSQFKDSLHSLMATLGSANPHFVRCIKPNVQKKPDLFDSQVVLNQLKYSGMMETVRIRRSGYPVRRLFDDFLFRYGVLGRTLAPSIGGRDKCGAIAKMFDNSVGGKDWQLGKTKVFYRETLERTLERQRDQELRAVCQLIYRVILTVVTRRRFLKAIARVVQVQKLVRAFVYRRKFLKTKRAAICMQKYERARQARKVYAQLLEAKRIEEERRREEERRLEEERQRELERKQKELERLEREKKEAEAAEMRRKLEEEERQHKLAEEERLRQEEAERQAAIQKIKELEEEHRRLEDERKRMEEEARLAAAAEAAELRARKEKEEQEKNEAKLQREAQEAYGIIGDLDNALKQFQGALGLSDTDVESDTEEEEYESEAEGVESFLEEQPSPSRKYTRDTTRLSRGEDEDEMFDPHSEKFRAEGQLMNYEDDPSFEGYLTVKGSKILGNKRRWAIIKDDILLFFEMKQDAIKQGWLDKKSSGSGTLGRRNWKQRYFALREKTLFYYADSDLATARPNGAIDLNDVSAIIEDGGSREHVFGVVTSERTYHLTAPDANEKREWCEVIRRVRSMPEAKVKSLLAQEVDPRNALLSLDIETVDSVSASDQEKRPNWFAVYTASRLYEFAADNPAEMHMWIGALSPKKFSLGDDDVINTSLAKGWLIKEGRIRRKRFFVLTDKFQLRYYKSEDTRQPVAGNIHLNCLCAIDPWDESESLVTGLYTFKLHARKSTYTLSARTSDDANEWMLAIQDAIDTTPTVQTITERLVLEIIKSKKSDWDRIYDRSKAMCRTANPIKAPLLALPYGKPPLPKEKEERYGTRHQEAVKIFNALLAQDSLADPIRQVQEVVEKCFDIPDLQSEVFCQLIKQTAAIRDDEIDSPGVLSCWQTLASMCCTFIPERAIKRYLVMHIKKTKEKYSDTEMSRFAEYCHTSLSRTKKRDFVPSRNEIIACLGRRDLNATVFCYGGGQCTININPSTTAGEVVQKLSLGLQISRENNLFGLCEVGGAESKVIDDRTVLVDVLGKFEMLHMESLKNIQGNVIPEKRKLFFKIVCFVKPQNVPSDSIENAFMFEQFCDDVVSGRFPASQERLMKLAALRMQFLEGDYKSGAIIEDVGELYPVSKIELEVKAQKDSIYGTTTNFHESYYANTLRGKKGIGTLGKKFKAPEITEHDKIIASVEVQKNTVKVSVVDLWKRLQGVTASQSQQKYLEILSECPAYASTVFEAEYTHKDQRFPAKLWLAINNKGVQIYQRGAAAPINAFTYETVVSFGAPAPNEYRLVVEGLVPISLMTTQVAEIAKLMTAYIRLVVVRLK